MSINWYEICPKYGMITLYNKRFCLKFQEVYWEKNGQNSASITPTKLVWLTKYTEKSYPRVLLVW